MAGYGKPHRVAIRRDRGPVRPEAEQIDGKVYVFRFGWKLDEDREIDDRYPGEDAMIANDFDWPADAPTWVASGDLQPVE